MKSLFTFLFTALFLIGCTDQHSHDHDHGHGEGEHHHAEGDSDSHDHDTKPEAPSGVRMGAGLMTFDTVPDWGLTANSKSAIGPTHGGVIVGKDGTFKKVETGLYNILSDIASTKDGTVAGGFKGGVYQVAENLTPCE